MDRRNVLLGSGVGVAVLASGAGAAWAAQKKDKAAVKKVKEPKGKNKTSSPTAAPETTEPSSPSTNDSAFNGVFAEAYSEELTKALQHLDLTITNAQKLSNAVEVIPSSFGVSGFLKDYRTAHIYDVALVIMAYLARGTTKDVEQAVLMGNALVQLQNNDPIGDGRLRNSYSVKPLMWDDGSPNISSEGSASGNLSWAGLALAKLYKFSGDTAHLNAAVELGEMLSNLKSSTGPGGFTGGYNSDGSKIAWKSTEHNIDAAAFYAELADITGSTKWLANSSHARNFVKSLWDGEKFVVGTLNDGTTWNTGDNRVLDVQSWGTSLLKDEAYYSAFEWVHETLEITNPDTGVLGVKYADGNDPTKSVWLEGSCQMVVAYQCQNNGSGVYLDKAREYLDGVALMQRSGDNTNGLGIISTTNQGNAGGGDDYYTSLHAGTTAWFVLAVLGANPFEVWTAKN